MKTFDVETFKTKLSVMNWSVSNYSNVQSACGKFSELLMSVFDSVAPIKQVRIKQKTEPWISTNILDCIKAKDNAFYSCRKCRCSLKYKQGLLVTF